MVVKNTETDDVVVKTTKPKVIVQTKSLDSALPVAATHLPQDPCSHHHKGKGIWKILIILLLGANLIVSILNYRASKEQQDFTMMSNGGRENYQMLKNLYESPAFQQASTLSIYQLVEKVNQTLASAQGKPEGTSPLSQ
jgi:hypothetical protein